MSSVKDAGNPAEAAALHQTPARAVARNTHRTYELQGFDPSLVGTKYGSKLYVWDWDTKKLRQTLELGADGLIPLEVAYYSVSLQAIDWLKVHSTTAFSDERPEKSVELVLYSAPD